MVSATSRFVGSRSSSKIRTSLNNAALNNYLLSENDRWMDPSLEPGEVCGLLCGLPGRLFNFGEAELGRR